MKVQCINYNSTKVPTSFKAYSQLKFNGEIPCYTTTMFFRTDMDWDNFIRFINVLYKNTPKVNVVCHACSDGEEAVSLALSLKTMLNNSSEKFFPIIAKDVNQDNIKKAQTGNYKITQSELGRMKKYCGKALYKLMDIKENGNDIYAKVNGFLSNKIIYNTADIMNDIQNIPHRNTILLCRNFWLYLKPYDRILLADQLSKHFTDSSLLVLGSFDTNNGIPDILRKAGFEKFGLEYVYRKNYNLPNTLMKESDAILAKYAFNLANRIL